MINLTNKSGAENAI